MGEVVRKGISEEVTLKLASEQQEKASLANI